MLKMIRLCLCICGGLDRSETTKGSLTFQFAWQTTTAVLKLAKTLKSKWPCTIRIEISYLVLPNLQIPWSFLQELPDKTNPDRWASAGFAFIKPAGARRWWQLQRLVVPQCSHLSPKISSGEFHRAQLGEGNLIFATMFPQDVYKEERIGVPQDQKRTWNLGGASQWTAEFHASACLKGATMDSK